MVIQNSLQESVNPECLDINRGLFFNCLRKEAMDISESRENLRFNNPKAFLNYPERTDKSSSTEDVITSYEGIQNVPEKLYNSQVIGKVGTEYLREFQDQNYELHSDGKESFDSSENLRVSQAVDKSENKEKVSYKSPKSLRNSELTDISDSKSEFEALNHLRSSLNKIRNSIKYDSYEYIRSLLDQNKWHFMPRKSEKRFLGAIIKGVGTIAVELGVGKLIDKIFD